MTGGEKKKLFLFFYSHIINSMSSPPPYSSEQNDATGKSFLSLEHAMKLADLTRKYYREDEQKKTNEDSSTTSSFPPGTLHGLSACAVTAIALLPMRKVILKHAGRQPGGKPFQSFVDIVISVGHALAATQVGFFIGSLYGSRTYLEMLQNEPPTSKCAVTDRICDTMWSNVLPPQLNNNIVEPFSQQSWDPRYQTMNSLQQAVESCRRRKEYQQSKITN